MSAVIRIARRDLPVALASSDEFQNLEEVGKQEFASRLRYVEEISVKLGERAESSGEVDDIKGFIDRIELDLMINLGAHGTEHRGVSTWLLHSSWTFETSAQKMRESLTENFLERLDCQQVGIHSKVSEFTDWAARGGETLAKLLDRFYASLSFDEVMAFLVAIDLCLAQMYCGFIAQRLNPLVLSSEEPSTQNGTPITRM